MQGTLSVWAAALVLSGAIAAAQAGAPTLIPVQGVLTDAGGTPLNTSVGMRFAFYDSSLGGVEVWSETQTVSVQDGLFTTYLGHVQSLDLALFREHDELWLGMQVGGEPEGQRIFIGTVPFSGFAQHSSYTAGEGITISDQNVVSSPLGSDIDSGEIQDGAVRRQDLSTDGCSSGQILKSDGTAWHCAEDHGEVYTPGSGIDIAGTTISSTLGASIESAEITDGTILRADLSPDGCTSGQVLKSSVSGWICAGDDNPQISCAWSGWQTTGSTTCPTDYICNNYICLRLYCDGTRVTQVSTTTCMDIYGYNPPWCPFFFSWNGERYVQDTTFIYKLDAPGKEAVQLRDLMHLDTTARVKAKIVELEPETSYIDTIRVVIVDSRAEESEEHELKPIRASRDLDRLLRSDDRYLITRQGDEVLLEFERAPPRKTGWSRKAMVRAEGYYVYHGSMKVGQR